MPGGDGTGSPRGSAGRGGRMGGNRPGAGPSGSCVCPKCGTRVTHQQGSPCYNQNCPKCGTTMTRE